MLSIQNETVLRDSASGALDTWRGLVPRGSALDQIMEDVMNHVRAAASEDDLRNEINELEERNKRLSDTVETYRVNKCKAEADLKKEEADHEETRTRYMEAAELSVKLMGEAADLRAQLAAALQLVPGSVSLGEFRYQHHSFAADFAELERLRVFEAARLEQDRQQAEAKGATPIWEPQPCSAEIPEEMFVPRLFRQMTDQGEVVIDLEDLSPEKREEIEHYVEALKKAKTEPVQITADPSPSRKRLDGIARRAQEVADGPCKVTDVRRLADLVSMLTNAVEPRR
jgi:hypothetical protein